MYRNSTPFWTEPPPNLHLTCKKGRHSSKRWSRAPCCVGSRATSNVQGTYRPRFSWAREKSPKDCGRGRKCSSTRPSGKPEASPIDSYCRLMLVYSMLTRVNYSFLFIKSTKIMEWIQYRSYLCILPLSYPRTALLLPLLFWAARALEARPERLRIFADDSVGLKHLGDTGIPWHTNSYQLIPKSSKITISMMV